MPVAAVEDVRPVLGAVHPGGDDPARGSGAAAPVADVLGDPPAAVAGQIPHLGQPARQVALARALMGEAAVADHPPVVGTGCLGLLALAMERPQMVAAPLLVDEAENGLRHPLVTELRRGGVTALALRCGGIAGQQREREAQRCKGKSGGEQASGGRHSGLVVRFRTADESCNGPWTGVRGKTAHLSGAARIRT